MQNYPDDAKRCDQQVITISSTLPVTRRGHGYQLHCHLGNNMSTWEEGTRVKKLVKDTVNTNSPPEQIWTWKLRTWWPEERSLDRPRPTVGERRSGLVNCQQKQPKKTNKMWKNTSGVWHYLDWQENRLCQHQHSNAPLEKRVLSYIIHFGPESSILCEKNTIIRLK